MARMMMSGIMRGEGLGELTTNSSVKEETTQPLALAFLKDYYLLAWLAWPCFLRGFVAEQFARVTAHWGICS